MLCLMKLLDWIFGQSATRNEGDTSMDIFALLNALSSTIAELQAKLVDAQAAVEEAKANSFAEGASSRQPEIDQKQADLDAKQVELDGKMGEIESLKQRIAELEGQTPPVDMTPFSQADLDAAVASAVGPMQAQIDELIARVAELESQPTGPSPEQVEQIKADAKAEVKAEIKAKLDEFEASNLA